jgi:hypothetical protein
MLKQQLTCVLGRENAREAFMLDLTPPTIDATWRSTVDGWLSWFSDCIVR